MSPRRSTARSLRVVLSGDEGIRAEIVGTDERTDLAVLRVSERGLPPLQLAETAQLRVGQLAVAVGNPLGFERSVSLGIVSALAANVSGNNPIILRDKSNEAAKTLKCGECGATNYPTEWYCERCGAELASL